jgi:hypothetical protein
MIRTALLVFAAGLIGSGHPRPARQHSYVPPNGFVPDSTTATRVAEAIWIPIYGGERIRDQRPYRATLHKGVWTVTGTLKQPSESGRRAVGGVALAEISKRDARILRVSHGR